MPPFARFTSNGRIEAPAKPDALQLGRLSPALVVDDNYLAAIDLTRWLDDWSIESRSTSRADAALRLASEMRPKLALVDVNLGGRFEGLPLARELQVLYGTKIVYITGYTLRDLKDRLARCDQVAVLFKPLDPDILGAVLANLSATVTAAH